MPCLSQSHNLPQLRVSVESSAPAARLSAPPSGLDECVFFISLVVGLPCSSIFCQFWLFFVFKLLSFFWLCEEAKFVYLCLHLGRKPQFYNVFKEMKVNCLLSPSLHLCSQRKSHCWLITPSISPNSIQNRIPRTIKSLALIICIF